MKPIKTGLIGYGLSGQVFHAPFLQSMPEFELTTVSTSKKEKAEQDLGQIHITPTPDALIQDNDIELIIITAPNEYHFPLAKAALESGKHVVIEKPFVVHSHEGKELLQIAEANNRLLSPFHNRRWDNDFLTVKKLIEGNALGDVTSYEAHFDRYRPHVRDRWREKDVPGAGILYDLGAHLIDQALHLFGSPAQVQGIARAQREGAEVDDYFHLLLDYNALQVILHSSSLVRATGPKFQVHGTKGSFIKYGTDPQENQLREGMLPNQFGWGVDSEENYGILTNDEHPDGIRVPTEKGSYESYYKQLAAAIRNEKQLPVTGQEGLNVIQIIEDILHSS
ncbi:oxidoreductase [Pontibacillus salipaludis]|uniref:Oxidoreductase n=1 Tax=Pontibacillus salipaludis TaxID=1697394 RepID=A0ABQ1PZ26_9BACI|nr:oxidoreductase [Pontibacillus salipaludis]GGD07554.1 oxidoreductase [Pontibacillus salipaludis]